MLFSGKKWMGKSSRLQMFTVPSAIPLNQFPSRSLDVLVISLEACGPLGNFNVLFSLRDKNGSSSNISNILLFRETVNDIGLIDLPLLNKSYTWSNGRRTPTLEHLDRAFISHDWVLSFLRSTLKALPRPRLDHTPLILTAYTFMPLPHRFRFETF